jgi:hypothetical protein
MRRRGPPWRYGSPPSARLAGRRYRQPTQILADGGAVAAGAAVGFIAGAAAAWVAETPPQSGMCLYYTDSINKTGF